MGFLYTGRIILYPIIDWAGFSVCALSIRFRQLEISLYHFQRTVPDQPFEGINISAIPQILDRKGMSETMCTTVLDAGPFT